MRIWHLSTVQLISLCLKALFLTQEKSSPRTWSHVPALSILFSSVVRYLGSPYLDSRASSAVFEALEETVLTRSLPWLASMSVDGY